jgi:hypothetical protein
VFIDTNLPGILAWFSNPGILAAKLVPASSPEIFAAYVVWSPASEPDLRTQEELETDLRKEADGLGEGIDKDISYQLRLEDGRA